MAEKEDDSSKVSFTEDWYSLIRSGESDPENGWVGGQAVLHLAGEAAMAKYINLVVNTILGNIQKGQLPSVKLLMDITGHLKGKDLEPTNFESLAKVIHKAFLKEQEELEKREAAQEREARMTIYGERTSLTVEPWPE